jgi:hypothetical protein
MSSPRVPTADGLALAQWLWGLLAFGTALGWGVIAALLLLARPPSDTTMLGALMHGGPALVPAGHAARMAGSRAQPGFSSADPHVPMPSELLIDPEVKW